MRNPNIGGDKMHDPGRSETIIEIRERAESASKKVKQIVANTIIPTLKKLGRSYGKSWLEENLEMDFQAMLREPKEKPFESALKGLSDEETRELYRVIHGKEIELD